MTYFMGEAAVTAGITDDIVEGQDLTAHVTGDAKIKVPGLSNKLSVAQYQWLIIVGALAVLWLLGGSFKRFIQ